MGIHPKQLLKAWMYPLHPRVWCLQRRFQSFCFLKCSSIIHIIPVGHTPDIIFGNHKQNMFVPGYPNHRRSVLNGCRPSVVVMSISRTFTKIRGRMVILPWTWNSRNEAVATTHLSLGNRCMSRCISSLWIVDEFMGGNFWSASWSDLKGWYDCRVVGWSRIDTRWSEIRGFQSSLPSELGSPPAHHHHILIIIIINRYQ